MQSISAAFFPVGVKSVRGDFLQLSTSMLYLNFVFPPFWILKRIPPANNQRNRPAVMINSKKSDFQRGRRVRQSLQNVTQHPFQLPVTNTAATQTPEILKYFGPHEHEALIKCNATEIYKIKYVQIKNIYIV